MIRLLGAVWSFVWVASLAYAGDIVGNGGDQLRLDVNDAKASVMEILQELTPREISKIKDTKTREWISSHQAEMLTDLGKTTFAWSERLPDFCATTSCACTLKEPASPIFFSLSVCSDRASAKGDYIKLILHELTHHLAVDDEDFADQIALEIFKLSKQEVRARDLAQSMQYSPLIASRTVNKRPSTLSAGLIYKSIGLFDRGPIRAYGLASEWRFRKWAGVELNFSHWDATLKSDTVQVAWEEGGSKPPEVSDYTFENRVSGNTYGLRSRLYPLFADWCFLAVGVLYNEGHYENVVVSGRFDFYQVQLALGSGIYYFGKTALELELSHQFTVGSKEYKKLTQSFDRGGINTSLTYRF